MARDPSDAPAVAYGVRADLDISDRLNITGTTPCFVGQPSAGEGSDLALRVARAAVYASVTAVEAGIGHSLTLLSDGVASQQECAQGTQVAFSVSAALGGQDPVEVLNILSDYWWRRAGAVTQSDAGLSVVNDDGETWQSTVTRHELLFDYKSRCP